MITQNQLVKTIAEANFESKQLLSELEDNLLYEDSAKAIEILGRLMGVLQFRALSISFLNDDYSMYDKDFPNESSHSQIG